MAPPLPHAPLILCAVPPHSSSCHLTLPAQVGVPRVWERVRESAMRRLDERPTPIGRWLFKCVGAWVLVEGGRHQLLLLMTLGSWPLFECEASFNLPCSAPTL